MDALAVGFCEGAISYSKPEAGSGEDFFLLWPSPTLQVVDIQRYPLTVTDASVTSRFYLAMSDSASLIWLVIPPGTDIEKLVSEFQIETGHCITLREYDLLKARNGFNVVVPITINYSVAASLLIGNPVYDTSLFSLSSRALVRHPDATIRVLAFKPTETDGCPMLGIRHIFSIKGRTPEDSVVCLRMIWKGKLRKFSTGHSADRFVFGCVALDSEGDAILTECFGSAPFYDMFDAGECVQVTNVSLAHHDKPGHGVRLQISEQISTVKRSAEYQNDNFPLHPCFMFGSKAVGDAAGYVEVGDIVSVEGIVAAVFPSALVVTRRGRVEQSKLLLQDYTSPSATLEVVLWGDMSQDVRAAVGERWCFVNFVVRMFMQTLTISSMVSSAAFKMNTDTRPPHGQRFESVPLNYTPPPPAASNETETEFLHVVFDLEEAAESLPVLAKVQRVELPVMYSACVECSGEVLDAARGCQVHGSASVEDRFVVRVELSDGLCALTAVGFSSVGEALFGMDAALFLQCRRESPNFERDVATNMVGLPFIFWLGRLPGGAVHIIKCQHLSMAHSAAAMLGAVEQVMERY
ncbi:hypothetical protein ERJ75_000713800 [Trypanosoma vivax]|uniref:Uncharacterized protein n=1 Tax=Trypanosoma vivax (strain Y486) TaxID=1055687 RepID=G0TTT3_TRYVY|nr:hypothetical protein TRVL_00065 [Trypanosoma vivax]KAH8614287.1 hypothetical protein ERJ75_000713800 [Trypanosoma vivax]CCC47365.1 conserved hypothetical protein [Trypanosoma vivax Y486]